MTRFCKGCGDLLTWSRSSRYCQKCVSTRYGIVGIVLILLTIFIAAGLLNSHARGEDWNPFGKGNQNESKVLGNDDICLVKYTASWCGPCQTQSRLLEEADFPYRINEVNVTLFTSEDKRLRNIDTIPDMRLIYFDRASGKWNNVLYVDSSFGAEKTANGYLRWKGLTPVSKITAEIERQIQRLGTGKKNSEGRINSNPLGTSSTQTVFETREQIRSVVVPAGPLPTVSTPWGTINLQTYSNPRCNCPMCQGIRRLQAQYSQPRTVNQVVQIQVPVTRTENTVTSSPALDAPAMAEVGQEPTPQETINRMLEALNLTESDHLVDLGCGDGRVLITAVRKYGCTGIGIEIDEETAEKARKRVSENGFSSRIRILTADARDFDPTSYGCTAATVFLYPETMNQMTEVFNSLDRISSAYHDIPGRETRKLEDVFVTVD